MFNHPYVIVASFCALVIFGSLISLAFIEQRGLKVHFEFRKFMPCFDVESSRPKGLTQKEVEKIVDDKVESHLSAMDVYKDGMKQYEDTAKTLIAHKLDDITIPVMSSVDEAYMQILDLTLKMELLLLNIENHYTQAAKTHDSLKTYVLRRYERLLRIFNSFSNDVMENHRVAFIVLNDWWTIVCPALLSSINQQKLLNESVSSVFKESSWHNRIVSDAEELERLERNLETANIKSVLSEYFVNVVQVDIPHYLE